LLRIRDEQIRVLSRAALHPWLVARVSRLLPQECASRGPRALDETVRDASARGRRLGFGDDELLSFVTLELLFGPDFEDAERNAWAREALADPAGLPDDRMQRLREAAVFHLAESGES
jgi:hypothetical protein